MPSPRLAVLTIAAIPARIASGIASQRSASRAKSRRPCRPRGSIDNAIKESGPLSEEDGKFLRAVNTAVVGAGLVVPTSGTVQYEVIDGGITRDTLWDSLKVMPNTPSNLEVHMVLLNNITIKEVGKFTRNEMGGDLAQDIMKNGWSLQEFMGVKWLITIKKGLVKTNTMYHFADPKFIGKSYILEDTKVPHAPFS